jgi:N-acetylneuraminic acid mutarotase
MQRPLSTLIFFLIIWLFATCDDDEETPDPSVITNEVTEIISGSATFNAELFAANQTILHHGFFWSPDPNPEFNSSAHNDLGNTTKSGRFQFKLTASLDPNTRYFVRSYLIYHDGQIENVVYGNEVSFLSPSASPPEISGFEPQHADMGDTVLITGDHFATNVQRNEVRFGNTYASVVSASATELSVIVPTEFNSRHVKISVSVFGNTTNAEQDFTLNPPVLYYVSPSAGYEGQQFYVFGKNFVPFHTTLYANSDSLEIWSISNEYVASVISNKVKPGPNTLSVKVFGEQTTLEESLTNLSPQIASISPHEVTFGDIVTITGSGFTTDLWSLSVAIGSSYAEIISASETQIEFKVPNDLYFKENFISVGVNDHYTSSSESIQLKAPVISDISPTQGPSGTVVTINGNNFSYSYTYVYFNDVPATINSLSHTEIVAEVPLGNSGMQDIRVQTGEQSVTAFQQFEIAPHEIYDFNPKKGSTGTVVTITGKNFSMNASSNYVTIGQFYCQVISSSADQLQVRIADEVNDTWGLSGQVSVTIGNNTATSVDMFSYTWVRKNLFTWWGRYYAMSFNYNNKGYIGMGYDGWTETDLLSYDGHDNWSTQTYFPGSSTGVYPLPFVIDDQLFVYSHNIGFTTTECWKYDLTNDHWQMVAKPDVDLFSASAFSVNGRGYLGLGADRNANLPNVFYEYNPNDSTWSQTPAFPGGGRTEAVTLEINDIRIVGLGAGANESLKDLYLFNSSDQSWTQLNDFPGHGRSAVTTFTLNNIAYIVGGYYPESPTGETVSAEVWAYDPSTDSWQRKSDFPGARYEAAGFVADGKAFVGTGHSGSEYKADLWEYHPENDQ